MNLIGTSWESISREIWLNIFDELPLKNQVSLACTCKKLYEVSLTSFLKNTEQRAWLYLEAHKPLPDLLAKRVTSLRFPAPPPQYELKEETRAFFKEQIARIPSLEVVLVEQKSFASSTFLQVEDLCALVECPTLKELRVPLDMIKKPSNSGRTLFHAAVASGNTELVQSLILQLSADEQLDGPFPPESIINEEDEERNTPLELGMQRGNREMSLLLLKKGAKAWSIS